MKKRFYTFLILAFNFIAVISQSQAPTITFGRLSDYEKSVNEPLHIILTQKETVMETQSVDLCHEDAYIYFINVQPTNVISLYSSQIKIHGEPMQFGVNARVAIYIHGTVVMPHSPEYKPLEVYLEKNFKVDSV